MDPKVDILVVDDSAVYRQYLKTLFMQHPMVGEVRIAANPYHAVKKIKLNKPDIITLDIEMPKMDGLTFLKRIMTQHPIPTVVISTLTKQGSKQAIEAMELGAVDVILKPTIKTNGNTFESDVVSVDKLVEIALQAKFKETDVDWRKKLEQSSLNQIAEIVQKSRVIGIGASTGGPEALRKIVSNMTTTSPGVVIVQHMPPGFTTQFASRLNEDYKVNVKEAQDGDVVKRGCVYLAPGNQHVEVVNGKSGLLIQTPDYERVNGHMPSVDVLFASIAKNIGRQSTGILLTGMGKDGAKGMLEMRKNHAMTMAQSKESCVVFGMPKTAIELNAQKYVVSVDEVSDIFSRL